MSRICPDCGVYLAPLTYQGVNLDSCPDCAGIWFDDGELRALQHRDPVAMIALEEKSLPHLEAQPHVQTDRRCPGCERVLDRYQYLYDSPIELDTCGSCYGIWVQDGELQKIVQYLESRQTPLSPREQAGVALAEMAAENQREMRRQAGLRGFFSLLNRRPMPWWV